MKHRGLSLLLALVFLLSVFMFCTTAFAAEKSADGLEAVLTTDKSDYVGGETINVSLDVTNTSIYVNNIRTELIIPEGVTLVEGQLKSEATAITVGETKNYGYVLSVPEVEVPTTGEGDTSPETRDITMVIFGALAVVSLAGLIALTFGAKLLKQRWFALVICAGLLLGLVAPVAANAAVTEKSFELTEAITIDGVAAEVKAIITYDLDDGEILASTVEFKKDGVSLYSLVPEKGWYTASNKSIVVDGVAASNNSRPEVTASYIDMLFGCTSTKTGNFVKGEFDNEKIISDTAEKQLLVGLTKDVASRKALDHINYDEWIIAEIDGKVVVTGWFDNATAEAARHLYNLVKDLDNVTLSLPITGKVEGLTTDFPEPTVGTFNGGMDGSGNTLVLRYGDMDVEKYETYAKELEAAGYELYAENEILNYGEAYNLYKTYTKGDSVVHIIYTPDDFVHVDPTTATANEQAYLSRSFRPEGCEMRIITDTKDHLFTNEASNEYTDAGITPKMSIVNLFNQVADGNNNAECIIYTLADGSFIVCDGGFNADAEHLYKALRELNEREDGKIVVAAWIMSHHHGDHIGAIKALAETENAKEITIEQFIFNPTAVNYYWRQVNAPYNYAGDFNFATYNHEYMTELLSKFGGDTQIVNPHMGQRMYIRNAEVEFMYTGDEDMFPLHMDNSNDSSLVYTVNFDMGTETTEDDTRVLMMNDSCCDTAYHVLHTLYSQVMDCDIVQVGHHGLGGPSTATYRMMEPTVAIWCSTESTAIKNNWFVPKTNEDGTLAGGTKGGSAGYLLYRLPDDTNKPVDLYLLAEHYVQTLELPYATGDVIDKRILTDYYTGLYATEKVDVAFLPAFHFRNMFNTNYDNILAELASYDADVLILTQADHESKLYPNGDMISRLLEDLDFTYAYYAPVWGTDYGSDPAVSASGTAGHMILSRYPINEAKTLTLVEGTPYYGEDGNKAASYTEGRATCYVQLDVDGLTLDVYATHFHNNANWAAFKEQFDKTQTGDYWMILGNTQIGGNATTAATKLGVESITALGTGDGYNVFADENMTFTNYTTDDSFKNSADPAYVNTNMNVAYKFTANLSHYMVSDDVRKPTDEYDFMAWTVNNYGGTQSIYEIISNELKYVHPETAVLIMVDDIRGITVTPEELAEFAGYEHCYFVEAWTYKDETNPLNARHRGSIIFSDIAFDSVEEDLVLVEDGTSKEGRAVGHVIMKVDGETATDIWFGFTDGTDAHRTALEEAVKKVADETGRPFIVYCQNAKFLSVNTTFAGRDVIDASEGTDSYICALSGTNAATDPLTLSDYYTYKKSILGISSAFIGDQFWMTFGEPFVKQQLTVENGSGSGSYKPGKEVTVTANDGSEGYAFDYWTAEGITLTEEQKTSAKITITMPKNAVTLKVVYKDVPSEYKEVDTTKDPVKLTVGSMMTYRFSSKYNATYEAEINEILKGYNLDVFALEQVAQNASGYGNYDMPGGLAKIEGYYSYYAPYWDNDYSALGTGTVGHMIFSKYPITFAETITYLYTGTSEDRGLAHAVIQVDENTYIDIYACAVGTAADDLPLIAEIINTKSKGDYWMLVGSHKTTASGFAGYTGQTGITASTNTVTANRSMLASAGLTLSDSGCDWDPELKGKINQLTGQGNPAEMHWATVTAPVMKEPVVSYGVKVDGEYVGFYTEGTEVTLTAPAAQAGYKFSGWNLPEGLILTEGTAADETIKFTMPAEILYFTVNHEKIQTATVSFNANGGYGTMADVVANTGSYTLPENGFLRPGGKVFAGWAESADGTPISTDSITLLENKTLYAIWEETENIEYLTWWVNNPPAASAEAVKQEVLGRDADVVALVTVKTTMAADLSAYAATFGYPHYQYVETADGRGNILLSKFSFEKKDQNGFMSWFEVSIKGVAVDLYMGYDCNGKASYIKQNATTTGNDFVLLGHTFGSSTYKNYDYGVSISGLSDGNMGAVVSLGEWEVVGTPATSAVTANVGGAISKNVLPMTVRQRKYTVSFDANGGTGTMDALTLLPGTYPVPKCGFTAPEGKMFAGWATKADGEVTTDETIKVTGDVTLYAVWKDYTELKVGYFSAYRFSGKYKTAATATEINNKILNLDLDVLVINQLERGSFVYPGHWNIGNGVVDALTEAVKSKYPYYYFASAGKIVDDTEGEYGNLILSKYPIEDYETISLADGSPFVHNTENNSYSGFVEGRPAGRVKLNVNGYTVDVYYTHAGNADQCTTLAAKIAESTADTWIAVGFLPSMDQKLTDYKQANSGNCRIMADSALVVGTLNKDGDTFTTYNTSSTLYSTTVCVPKG